MVEENGLDPVPVRNGRVHRYRGADVQVDDGNEDDGELLVVTVKLRPTRGGGGSGGSGGAAFVKRKPVEPDEPELRPKVNRFASKVTAAPVAAAIPPAEAFSAVAADDPNAPPPGAPRAKFTPRTGQGAVGHSAWGGASLPVRWKKYALLTLAALVVGYMAGKRFGHPAAAAPAAAVGQGSVPIPKLTITWSPARLAQLDAVLAADQAGDLKSARQLALDLRKDLPDSPDLDLYISTLQIRQGDFKDPENDLSKSIDAFTPPREAAAINAHLGFVYTRSRDFPRAAQAFSDAASTEPFNPTHFRLWGETLRRQGQLQEAVDHFRQALTRLPVGRPELTSQREEIGLKVRLAQIEMGKDDEVKGALDPQLRLPVPGGYWFVTAAAYALQHKEMGTAASYLQKARVVLPTEDYNALTNDYFFHSFTSVPEVANLLPPDRPAVRVQPFVPQMGFFIDP